MKPTGQDRGRGKGMGGEPKDFRKDGNAPFRRPKEEENPGPRVRVWRDKPLEARGEEKASGPRDGGQGKGGPPARGGRFGDKSGPRREWGPRPQGRDGGDGPRGAKFGPKFGAREGGAPAGGPRGGRFGDKDGPRREWGPRPEGRDGGDGPRGSKFGPKFGGREGGAPTGGPRGGRFGDKGGPRREWGPRPEGREGGDAPRGAKFGPKFGARDGGAAPDGRPRREFGPRPEGRDGGDGQRGGKFGPKFGARDGGPRREDAPRGAKFGPRRDWEPREEGRAGSDEKLRPVRAAEAKAGLRGGNVPLRVKREVEEDRAPEREESRPKVPRRVVGAGGGEERPRRSGFAAKGSRDSGFRPKFEAKRATAEKPETAPQKTPRKAANTAPKVEAKGGQKTLERVLSKAGMGSRTEARSWVHAGRVKVNGKIVENPDMWIDFDRDKIEFDGAPLAAKDKLYILLYKPAGYLSTYKDPEGRKTVYDLLTELPSFVGTVGRLDEDSSGLLILSNDNQFAERLTNPDYHVPKTYLVKCSTLISDESIEALRKGVELNDGPTKPAEVVRVRDQGTKTFLEITLREGRNRQVRRMIEAIGSKVLKLVRTRIGNVEIGDLASGKWRKLTAAEIASLNPKRGRA